MTFPRISTIEEKVRDAFNAEWSPVAAIKLEAAEYYADLFARRYPEVAKRCGDRLKKAVKIMTTVGASQRGEQLGVFLVRSQHNPTGWYYVDLLNKTCTCPDHPSISAMGGVCKHRLSIGLRLYGNEWSTVEVAKDIRAQREAAEQREAAALREQEAYHALQVAEASWDAQCELVDRWEYHVNLFGYHDPRSLKLHEEVLEATRHAEALQAYANKL